MWVRSLAPWAKTVRLHRSGSTTVILDFSTVGRFRVSVETIDDDPGREKPALSFHVQQAARLRSASCRVTSRPALHPRLTAS